MTKSGTILVSANRARSHSFGQADPNMVAALQQKYRERTLIPCTKSNYCIPCPNGVNIPANFEIYNEAFLHEDVQGARFKYQIFIPEGARASGCIACHTCEDRCPKKFPSATGCPKFAHCSAHMSLLNQHRNQNMKFIRAVLALVVVSQTNQSGALHI